MNPNGDIALSCVAVQEAYFSLVEAFGQHHENTSEKLAKRFQFTAASAYRLGFTIYNTAWLSQNPEKPGQLYIPPSVLISQDTPADLEIALLHHPYNWLDPDNVLPVRTHLQSNADIILSGHQHQAADQHSQDLAGAGVYIVEARAMRDPRASENGFDVILVNPAEAKWQVNAFVLENGRYIPKPPTSEWLPFLRNKALEEQGFNNTRQFKTYLADAGVPFTHGRKSNVLLHDIFVYPELRQRDLQRKIDASKPLLCGLQQDVLQLAQRVMIVGDQKEWPPLSKMLYQDLQRVFKLVPLLLTPDLLNTFTPAGFRNLIQSALTDQYGSGAKETFFEVPVYRRALIIDDLHRCTLNQRAREALICTLESLFEVIVVFVNPGFETDLLVRSVNVPLFATYRQFYIEEMGHLVRGVN